MTPEPSDTARPVPSRIARAAAFVSWGMIALLLVDLLVPGRIYPATLLSNVRHLVCPLFLPLFVVALAERRWLRAGACAAGLVMGTLTVTPWFSSPTVPRSIDAGESTVRIVTANLADGASDGAPAATAFESSDADVILLQEVSPHHRDAMEAPLRTSFPHQLWRALGVPGKAVLSRHPILEEEWSEFPARVTIQTVRIDVGERRRPLRIANVKLSATAAWTGRGGAGFDALEEFAADGRGDELRIIAGDLNTSPWGGVVARLDALGLRSAYSTVGAGAGFTFPVSGRYRALPIPPAVRIDYVLIGPGGRAMEAEVGPDVGSDHLPMMVRIAME